jgi:uncharacterized protein YraI
MRHMVRGMVFALFFATLPLAAAAQQAFTLRDVDVFAGPSSEYPQIAELPPGTSVQLAGCLSDWSWCDVIFANDRGWVYAGDLGYPYQGNRVVILEYGPRLHLTVVSFSLDTYWSAHYRARPFFAERSVWVNRVHIQANRGGPPPHGRSAQATPGGQSAQPAQPAQRAQPAQPAPQPQAAQPQRREEQARPAQPAQPQGAEAMRPQERAAQQPQRPQPEGGQAQGDQRERRARPADENAAQQGTREQQPTQPQARQAPNAGRQPEAMQAPQAGEAQKAGRQPEAMRAPEANKEKASEGKRAPDRERPKEEGQ